MRRSGYDDESPKDGGQKGNKQTLDEREEIQMRNRRTMRVF